MRLGPVGFLFAVAVLWVAARAVMLWPRPGTAFTPPMVTWHELSPRRTTLAPPSAISRSIPATLPRSDMHPRPLPAEPTAPPAVASLKPLSLRPVRAPAMEPRIAPIASPLGSALPERTRQRLAISAWAILRAEGDSGLAAAGQLGGSQAGARLRYDLGSGLAAAARVSTPLPLRMGREAAIGLDWRPSTRIPLTLTVERRIGLDRGGRDAFAAGVVGGVDSVRLPAGLRLDAYGQAGMVGGRRRDAYVDGAVRLERSVILPARSTVAAGVGLWGGAQPGASRLDLGPQIVVRTPIASGGLRIGLEWRERVAGSARPGSGPVLSIGTDF